MLLINMDVTDIYGSFLRLSNQYDKLRITVFDKNGMQSQILQFESKQDLRNLRDALTLLLGKGK